MPSGHGQSKSMAGKPCNVWYDYKKHDSCDPDKEFCYTYPGVLTVDGKHVGHCCSKLNSSNANVKLKCPIENTQLNQSCHDQTAKYQPGPNDCPGPQRTCLYPASPVSPRYCRAMSSF